MAQQTKTQKTSSKANKTSAVSKLELVEKKHATAKHIDFNPGDTIKVHVKIKEGDKERVQAYEGVVMAFSSASNRRTFTVRKISHGVGVERVFPMHSPNIAKIEMVNVGRVRRAKISYLRGLSGKAARVKSESDKVVTAANTSAT